MFIQFPKWRSAPGIPVVQGETAWVFKVVKLRQVRSLLHTTLEVIKELWVHGYPHRCFPWAEEWRARIGSVQGTALPDGKHLCKRRKDGFPPEHCFLG